MLRILDLFCGVGGVAKGFQTFLDEHGIKYKYVVVDIDECVLTVHKRYNPKSITVCRDAWSISDDEIKEYDFVWASPPCTLHSRTNIMLKRYVIDDKLYLLIERLNKLKIPYVVENTMPWYRPRIPWVIQIDRHCFWTNLVLFKCKHKPRPKRFDYMNIGDWMRYHEVPQEIFVGVKIDKRKALRNMVNPTLAYNIARQVIPQVLLWKKYGKILDGIELAIHNYL